MLLAINDESLHQAAQLIRRGDLVAFPTETVHGLGADAFNTGALARIFEVKGRPNFDPLIIHIAETETLEKIADFSALGTERVKKIHLLAEKLWPGPLSLVLPKRESIPPIATSGLPTLAVRLPDHPAAKQLISLSTGAVAAPSANPFGCLSPTRAEHVRDLLGEKIDIILDGGSCRIGLESTVLDMSSADIRILRPGGTPKEAIEELIGNVLDASAAGKGAEAIVSPGMLESHYAPATPFLAYTREAIIKQSAEAGSAFVFFDGESRDAYFTAQKYIAADKPVIRVLSEAGNLHEAAAALFEILHELDKLKVRRIIAQFAPEDGLGAAINDRLRRAQH